MQLSIKGLFFIIYVTHQNKWWRRRWKKEPSKRGFSIVQFRIRRGRRKKHLRLIYTGLASTKGKYILKFQSEENPVCTTVSFVFNSHDFRHILAGICEYFNLGRGYPCTNKSSALLFQRLRRIWNWTISRLPDDVAGAKTSGSCFILAKNNGWSGK